MALITLIARIPDSLMLAESAATPAPEPPSSSPASSSSSTGSGGHRRGGSSVSPSTSASPSVTMAEQLELHRQQAKLVFHKLNDKSPAKLAIDAGTGFYYAYVMRNSVCVLAVCERTYPRKLAFDFVSELLKEFETSYGTEVAKATRPYAFIKFDTFIQKTQRLYSDTRSQLAIEKVSEELRDAQRVMTQNIQDILERGDKISAVATRSEALVSETSRYQKQARDFESFMWWRHRMPIIVVAVIVVLLLLLRMFVF